MIPIKIQCGCGQRYAFEVEPAGGRMPAPVACPVCAADGTAAANEIIARGLAQRPGPPPLPSKGGSRVQNARGTGRASPVRDLHPVAQDASYRSRSLNKAVLSLAILFILVVVAVLGGTTFQSHGQLGRWILVGLLIAILKPFYEGLMGVVEGAPHNEFVEQMKSRPAAERTAAQVRVAVVLIARTIGVCAGAVCLAIALSGSSR